MRKERITSTETNKAIVRGVYEVINARELDRLGWFVSDDLVEHAALPGEESIGGGLELLKGQFEMALGAFPYLRYEIEDEISEGNKGVVRWRAQGTHWGDLMGVAPTGTRITLASIHVMRVESGKVVEPWGQQDSLGLMQ